MGYIILGESGTPSIRQDSKPNPLHSFFISPLSNLSVMCFSLWLMIHDVSSLMCSLITTVCLVFFFHDCRFAIDPDTGRIITNREFIRDDQRGVFQLQVHALSATVNTSTVVNVSFGSRPFNIFNYSVTA